MKTITYIAAGLLASGMSLSFAADPKPKAKEMAPTGLPAITRLEPRGVQRGVETRLKLVGSNLAGLTNVTFHGPKLTGALLPDAKAGEVIHGINPKSDDVAGEVADAQHVCFPQGCGGEVRSRLFLA